MQNYWHKSKAFFLQGIKTPPFWPVLFLAIISWVSSFLLFRLALTREDPFWINFVFSVCSWLIFLCAGAIFFLEFRYARRSGRPLTLLSQRSLAYILATASNLFLPVSSVYAVPVNEASLWAGVKTLLFLCSSLALFFIVIVLRGGPQPTWKDGRYIPILFAWFGFSLVMFL